MKHAIVDVEDKRFYEHRGVDFHGIVRALWEDVRHKSTVQGGSTITQQFVKNALVHNERTISRKLKEAALAWQLESGPRHWSKIADPHRVPEHDLPRQRRVRRRDGVEGVLRPQREDADLAEAALLAGIPEDPSRWDPVDAPARREGAAPHGAARDARPGAHHARRLRPREPRAAAEARGRAAADEPEPEGAVLHELREAAARRALRIVDRVRRRPARAHVDQPAGAAGRTRRDREVARLDRRAERGARRDRPARRPRARDGRRRELPPVAVQPRGAGRAAAGLVVQAVRARDRARGRHRTRHDVRLEAGHAVPRRDDLAGDTTTKARTSARSTCSRRRSTRTTASSASSRRRSGRTTSCTRRTASASRARSGPTSRSGSARRRSTRSRWRARSARSRTAAFASTARIDKIANRPRAILAVGGKKSTAPRLRRQARHRLQPSRAAGASSARTRSRRRTRSCSASSPRARARAQRCRTARRPARRARPRTTATRGSSATRRSSSRRSGSATRTSSSR